jgi:hypothetical protein
LLKKAVTDADYEKINHKIQDSSEFMNSVEKMKVLEDIDTSEDSQDNLIFQRLVGREYVSLDDLGRDLG